MEGMSHLGQYGGLTVTTATFIHSEPKSTLMTATAWAACGQKTTASAARGKAAERAAGHFGRVHVIVRAEEPQRPRSSFCRPRIISPKGP